jgi:hypothetical protein
MAQFIVIPPLQRVAALFSIATTRPLEPEVTWTAWSSIPDTVLEEFRQYIRPCHHKLLNETLTGKSPLAFLRQLLRPHGYRIETTTIGWRLTSENAGKGIRIQSGVTISFND